MTSILNNDIELSLGAGTPIVKGSEQWKRSIQLLTENGFVNNKVNEKLLVRFNCDTDVIVRRLQRRQTNQSKRDEHRRSMMEALDEVTREAMKELNRQGFIKELRNIKLLKQFNNDVERVIAHWNEQTSRREQKRVSKRKRGDKDKDKDNSALGNEDGVGVEFKQTVTGVNSSEPETTCTKRPRGRRQHDTGPDNRKERKHKCKGHHEAGGSKVIETHDERQERLRQKRAARATRAASATLHAQSSCVPSSGSVESPSLPSIMQSLSSLSVSSAPSSSTNLIEKKGQSSEDASRCHRRGHVSDAQSSKRPHCHDVVSSSSSSSSSSSTSATAEDAKVKELCNVHAKREQRQAEKQAKREQRQRERETRRAQGQANSEEKDNKAVAVSNCVPKKTRTVFNYPTTTAEDLVSGWPESITELYLDGNNMLYVTDEIRASALKRGGRKTAEAKLTDFTAQALRTMHGNGVTLDRVTLLFDNVNPVNARSVPYTTPSVNAHVDGDGVERSSSDPKIKIEQKDITVDPLIDSGAGEVGQMVVGAYHQLRVCGARPAFATSDDLLVHWAQHHPNLRGCLFVTSDRGLSQRLHDSGARIMKPKAWFQFMKSLQTI